MPTLMRKVQFLIDKHVRRIGCDTIPNAIRMSPWIDRVVKQTDMFVVVTSDRVGHRIVIYKAADKTRIYSVRRSSYSAPRTLRRMVFVSMILDGADPEVAFDAAQAIFD